MKNFSFPFFGPQSDKFKLEFSKIISKYLPNVNVRMMLVNDFTIGSFFRYKDRLPPEMCSSLVYQFSCSTCSSRYVGSTNRNLYMRVREHSGRSYRTGERVANPVKSSIMDHAMVCDTKIDLDRFKILSCSNKFNVRILETLFIFRLRPELNDFNSAFPLVIVRWFFF